MIRLLYQAIALMGAGSVKTTWKYSTGSRSAWRASSQRCAALAWHFGQWRSRHELKDTSVLAQPEQRSTCPPSAAVRHRSMADMTFSCPRLRRVVARQAGPWARKMSATSTMRHCAVSVGGQALQRTGDLAQQVGGHLRVKR